MSPTRRLLPLFFALALVAMSPAVPRAFAATTSLPSIRIDGAAAGDLAGTSVAGAGDVNGDGHRDLVIGAPAALPTGNGGGGGVAYVVFGPFTAGTTIDLANLGTRGFAMRGSAAGLGESAGTSVAGAGDVNHDGLADVIVGAPGASPSQEGPMTQPGRAYIVFGSRTPRDVTLATLGASGITLTGASHRFPDVFGWQVAPAGDVNHDGLKDVVIAAPGNPGFEEKFTRGRAYVIYGRRSAGVITMARLGRRGFRIGLGSGGQMTSVSGVGDWNRDGRSDVAVADGGALNGRGAVWVIYGRGSGRSVDLAHLGHDGLLIAGSRLRRYALQGAAVTGGADVNGDRRPDLVLGEPASHYFGAGPANGGAWLVPGSARQRPIDLSRASASAWELALGSRGWVAGSSVGLGRINADALSDTVLLAHGTPAVVYGTRVHRTVRLATMTPAQGFLVDPSAEPPGGAWSAPGSAAFTTVGTASLRTSSRAEILAGARFAGHNGRERSGSAYVFLAP